MGITCIASRFNLKNFSLLLHFLKNPQIYVIVDYLEWIIVREAPLEDVVTYAWYIKVPLSHLTLNSLIGYKGLSHTRTSPTITLSPSLLPLLYSRVWWMRSYKLLPC
jgi:hypothetical protein